MTNSTPPADDAPQPLAQPRLACGDCGAPLDKDSRGMQWDDRWPCPRCGSLKRAVGETGASEGDWSPR